MKNLLLITSKKSKYFSHIKKIIDDANFKVYVAYIEDQIDIDDKDFVIYLICNITDLLKFNYSNIINYQFYKTYKTKKDIQLLLSKNNIIVPNILNNIERNVFLKENKHEGIVMKFYDIEKAKEFIIKNNIIDYYLEEVIDGYIFETKYYFVYDKIFNYDEEINDINIVELCFKISRILKLEVFSIDVINKDNKNYVIDVNSSPGFYKSNVARKYFLDEFNKKN